MSQEHGRDDVTYDITADLSAYRNRFVKLTAAHTVGLCGNGERAIGVLKNMPDNVKIKSAAVRQFNAGVSSKIVAGAAIAAGAAVASDANGKGKTAATGNQILGVAREPAAADGDVIELIPQVSGIAP